jgi:hypothetical protein
MFTQGRLGLSYILHIDGPGEMDELLNDKKGKRKIASGNIFTILKI